MRNYRGTYVHRGDSLRRRARLRRLLLLLGFVAATSAAVKMRAPEPAAAEAAVVQVGRFGIGRMEAERLQTELVTMKGELDLIQARLDRAERVMRYSSQYRIGADLAGQIFDIAQAEGLDADLAFRLVRLESEFNPRAKSPVGAIGLTQVMPSTARLLVKGITVEKLYEPATNLRLGFSYLRGLLDRYDGDVKLALLAYNRGEFAVNSALKRGENPTNGYDRVIMRGYVGNGLID
jgi:soluble lytic murein transglycosylase-like protein